MVCQILQFIHERTEGCKSWSRRLARAELRTERILFSWRTQTTNSATMLSWSNSSQDLIEVTKKEVKPMFFHRPSMTSSCVQLRALRLLPPESDLHDDQIRNMLTSPLYLQEREASADRPRVYHSFREISESNSYHFRESAGRLAAVFSH